MRDCARFQEADATLDTVKYRFLKVVDLVILQLSKVKEHLFDDLYHGTRRVLLHKVYFWQSIVYQPNFQLVYIPLVVGLRNGQSREAFPQAADSR